MSDSRSSSNRLNLHSKSVDRGKRPSKHFGVMNHEIYLDLNSIIRVHALPFLPAKSLFRFQGVCRDWKQQISTPFFAHSQSVSFHAISGLFCQTPGSPPSIISIDPKSCGVPQPSLSFLPVPVDIRASSIGLLCCQARTNDKSYYICNPVTQKWNKLPKQNADHGHDPAVVLVFEPSLLNFAADYKLICAFPSSDFDDATEFELYSSKENSWKISGEICFSSRKLIPSSGVHVNGIVYWQDKRGSILAFDLTKERSQLIPCYSGPRGCLGASGGGKLLCRTHSDGHSIVVEALANIHTNTMQMGSKAKTWVVKHRIPLNSKVFGGPGIDHEAVMFVSDDTLVGQHGKAIYSYNLKTKVITHLCQKVEQARYVCYVNGLVCI